MQSWCNNNALTVQNSMIRDIPEGSKRMKAIYNVGFNKRLGLKLTEIYRIQQRAETKGYGDYKKTYESLEWINVENTINSVNHTVEIIFPAMPMPQFKSCFPSFHRLSINKAHGQTYI